MAPRQNRTAAADVEVYDLYEEMKDQAITKDEWTGLGLDEKLYDYIVGNQKDD